MSGGSNSSSVQRGISATYTGAIYLASMTAVTAVGAGSATSMASTTVTSEPNAAPGMRKVEFDPHGPFPDPIGDVAWPVMLLLVLAYACVIYRKRTRV